MLKVTGIVGAIVTLSCLGLDATPRGERHGAIAAAPEAQRPEPELGRLFVFVGTEVVAAQPRVGRAFTFQPVEVRGERTLPGRARASLLDVRPGQPRS